MEMIEDFMGNLNYSMKYQTTNGKYINEIDREYVKAVLKKVDRHWTILLQYIFLQS